MTESVTPESVGRAGGCEWFADGTRVQYTRCEPCMFGACPGGWHQWAGPDDVEHAASTGQADPSGQKCGCVCADVQVLEDQEPDWEPLDLDPCPVCGSDDACGYDSEGRPLIHALGPEVDL